MNKNGFRIEILPITHFLIGISYESGISNEDPSVGVDSFTLGLALINISFNRFYNVE